MAASQTSTLKILFTNKSTFSDDEVSVGFVRGSSSNAFNVVNEATGTALQPVNVNDTYPFGGNWYKLSSLTSGVGVTNFSGRIYVAYQTPWSVTKVGYEPAQAVNDPNLFLRYDKMEITFNGDPSDVANLTSIDYWSIPMTLQTSLNGSTVQTVSGLLSGTTAQDVFDALNALTTPPVSKLSGPGGVDGTPLPALVPGEFQQFGDGPAPGTTFARIIGPSSYPPINAIPVTPYDTLRDYLQCLYDTFGPGTKAGSVIPGLGAGTIATISGNFAGVGPVVPPSGPQSRQAYNLTATIDDSLDITLSGAIGSGTVATTMVYKIADLMNPTGIYGGNSPFYLNGASTGTIPGNDVYGWIGGDLFSGLNIGAVGSTVLSEGTGSEPVGQLESSEWFKLPVDAFYSKMQPGTTYYNQWAATLQPFTQAYNFAYTDRFAHVFASLDPATTDTLTVVLEDAAVVMSS
jgi:hypothetical protein